MNQPIRIHWLAYPNCQVEALVTLTAPARGVPDGILAEYGGDAEDVPHSVGVVAFMLNFRHVVRGQA